MDAEEREAMSDKNDEGKERERVTKEEMERVLWRGKEWVLTYKRSLGTRACPLI